MKKFLALLLIPLLYLEGCATFQNDATITTAVALGASAGFKFLKGKTQKEVTDWVYTVAHIIRSASGTVTPDQLAQAISDSIPASVKAEYPDLLSFLVPIVVSNYKTYYDKFAGNNAKLVQVLNDIATGLESAAAQYRTQ